MDLVGLIVSAVGGLLGGNAAGMALKDKSLGTLGNTIAGAVGGVAGTYILQAVNILQSMGMADMTLGSIAASAGTSLVSGGILTAIIGFIKNAMARK